MKDTIKTGFEELDQTIEGLKPGKVYVIAGRPHMGKTVMALNILKNVALDDQKTVFYYTNRTGKIEMYQKLLQRLSRITFRNFYEIQDVQTIQENIEEVLKAKKLIRQSGLRFITSDESSYEQFFTVEETAFGQNSTGLDLVMVDENYLLEEQCKHYELSFEKSYKRMLAQLRNYAKLFNIPIILLCGVKSIVDERIDKKPQLCDIKTSNIVRKYTDIAILLYREQYYHSDTEKAGIVELIICNIRKGRYEETIEMGWLSDYLYLAKLDY